MSCKKDIILFIVIFFFIQITCDAVNTGNEVGAKSDSTRLFSRKHCLDAGVVINTTGILYGGYKWWWRNDYHTFHIRYEGLLNNYSYGVDKFGHFYISYLYFNSVYYVMKWGGYTEKRSLRNAIFLPFLWALTIEIGDGFSSYAFSADDLAANMLGITYGYLQLKYPYLQNFNIKWSYYPTDIDKWKKRNLSLSDDYDGHFYWLSCNVKGLLPESMKRYVPKYLNLAVGYGAVNVSAGCTGQKHRKFAIGIDYNLSCLSFKNNKGKPFFRMLDFFKFPAPAYRYEQSKGGEFKAFMVN